MVLKGAKPVCEGGGGGRGWVRGGRQSSIGRQGGSKDSPPQHCAFQTSVWGVRGEGHLPALGQELDSAHEGLDAVIEVQRHRSLSGGTAPVKEAHVTTVRHRLGDPGVYFKEERPDTHPGSMRVFRVGGVRSDPPPATHLRGIGGAGLEEKNASRHVMCRLS